MIATAVENTKTAWLGEFPEHWEVLRIKNVATVNDEALSESTNPDLSIKYIDIGNVNSDGEINEIQEFKFSDAPSRARRVLRKGDVIISTVRTYLKAITQISFDVENHIASTGFAVLRPKDNILSDYLSYAVRAKYFIDSIMVNSFGVSYPAINSSVLVTLPILVPPKTEQDEIVQYIKAQEEKINLFIQKKQRLIELLKEQRQSKIDEAVDGTNKIWLNKKLKYIAEIKFSNVDKHTIEDEIPVRLCNYVDVYKNDYITNDLEFMNATATETEIEKFTVLKGDVIITKDSEEATDIAVPTFVKEHLENVVCGYHLALIRANENEILNEYLFRKFQSSELKAYFAIEATGVTRVGLSMGEITGVKISYPKSIEEQKQLVAHIKSETATIDTAIAKADREIELIREYKDAMIAEAVMGKRK
jgi:type I restriction enzyme, S subunit